MSKVRPIKIKDDGRVLILDTDDNEKESRKRRSMGKKLTIKRVETGDDLYCKYDGQIVPQKVYLKLDCEDESAEISYDPEIGNSQPMSVWHGREIWFRCPLYMSVEQSNGLLDYVADRLNEILDGYTSGYDEQSNFIGKLSADASERKSEVEIICESWISPEEAGCKVCEATDYFCNISDWSSLGIKPGMSAEEIEVILESEAEEECEILEGVKSLAEDIFENLQVEEEV